MSAHSRESFTIILNLVRRNVAVGFSHRIMLVRRLAEFLYVADGIPIAKIVSNLIRVALIKRKRKLDKQWRERKKDSS